MYPCGSRDGIINMLFTSILYINTLRVASTAILSYWNLD